MIYVASSWKNLLQQEVVGLLRENNFDVYDFKNPIKNKDSGFSWEQIDENYQEWSMKQYVYHLHNTVRVIEGFDLDYSAMQRSNCCILVLPCGRSAHLEAGWFVGRGRPLYILLNESQFQLELMYKMATGIYTNMFDLINELNKFPKLKR